MFATRQGGQNAVRRMQYAVFFLLSHAQNIVRDVEGKIIINNIEIIWRETKITLTLQE